MGEWWRQLKGRPFYWVLDGSHPPAVLFMLRYVIERPPNAPVLRSAQLALQESSKVGALKARLGQEAEALWVLRLLAELGGGGVDMAVAEALDQALDCPVPASEPYTDSLLLHIALAFGFHQDERVQQRLEWLLRQLEAGPPGESPQAQADWLCLLAMALAELPAARRDAASVAQLEAALATLDPAQLPRYQRYAFPTFVQPDALILARSALRLGMEGAWLAPWVEQVVAAQDDQGLWHLEAAPATPGDIYWEVVGQPSRWISAQALYILRAFYGE